MWDIFISHASEDKDQIARPLAEKLSNAGFKVWYDDLTLKLGDSLNRTINRGLANSQYGIVILSPSFFAKEWPQRELDGLSAREINSGKIILPVLHNITYDEVTRLAPILADKLAVSTDKGLDVVVRNIIHVLRDSKEDRSLPVRQKRKSWQVLFTAISLTVLTLIGIQGYRYYIAQLPEKARTELGVLSLDYTQESFIETVKRGDTYAVDLFLTAGIDPNASNTTGTKALVEAVIESDLDMVKLLLSAQGIDVNAEAKSYRGASTLAVAVDNENVPIIEAFLKAGANVDNALAWAGSGGNEAILHILLQHEPSVAGINGALVNATARGNLKLMHILLDKGANAKAVGNEALIQLAVQDCNSKVDEKNSAVTLLISLDADINKQESTGATPLHYAAIDNCITIVRTLLNAEADVNTQCIGSYTSCDGFGFTPLLSTLKAGHLEIAEAILAQDVDVNAKNDSNHTALMILATLHEHDDARYAIASTLLAKGAEINAKDNYGGTTLMRTAINDDNPEMLQLFLDAGAFVDEKDNNGHTALMYAAAWNKTENVRLLLDKGAHVDEKDNYGNSVLLIAKQGYRPSMVNKLITGPFSEDSNNETVQLLQQTLKQKAATIPNNTD